MVRVLTEEEDQIPEWLKVNRSFYDKSRYVSKSREKEERTWLEMDQILKVNPGDLFRRYSGLRTQYVKTRKEKFKIIRDQE